MDNHAKWTNRRYLKGHHRDFFLHTHFSASICFILGLGILYPKDGVSVQVGRMTKCSSAFQFSNPKGGLCPPGPILYSLGECS